MTSAPYAPMMISPGVIIRTVARVPATSNARRASGLCAESNSEAMGKNIPIKGPVTFSSTPEIRVPIS